MGSRIEHKVIARSGSGQLAEAQAGGLQVVRNGEQNVVTSTISLEDVETRHDLALRLGGAGGFRAS